jgi:hypothetical protein
MKAATAIASSDIVSTVGHRNQRNQEIDAKGHFVHSYNRGNSFVDGNRFFK